MLQVVRRWHIDELRMMGQKYMVLYVQNIIKWTVLVIKYMHIYYLNL